MLGNWIRQTTTTTGTGDLTLASVSGYPTFSNQFDVGGYFLYAIIDDATGAPYETGIGHLSSSTVLVRDKPRATYASGTYDDNDPAATTLPAGTKRVICAIEQGAICPVVQNINSVSTYKLRYPTGWIIPSSAYDTAVIADIVYYIPTLINAGSPVDALLFRVSVLAAGSTAIVGIYDATIGGMPKTRLDQSASISCATSGVKVGALTKRRYKPGLYFLAVSFTGGAPSINVAAATGVVDHLLGGDSNMLTSNVAFYQSTTAGALPATAAVTSGVRDITVTPLVAMRLA